MRSLRLIVLSTRLTYLNRRHQSHFRGLVDVLRVVRKIPSFNTVDSFLLVWMASLSQGLVRDLVDLDVSLIAIAYCDVQ